MGPKTREWGFHMPEGWLGWKAYYARLKAGEDMRREQSRIRTQAAVDDFDDEAVTEPRGEVLS
jgi:hypothetical protein